MVIRVNRKKVIARAIEWADKEHKIPVGLMLKCPYCRKEQWVHRKHLYTGYDNSKNNHRCKHCRIGLARKRQWGNNDYQTPTDGFEPKTPGWRSID